MPNRLYYGDNLDVLRRHIADDSVDLIYLDPPFNSNAGYNLLFKAPDGSGSAAQIEAFDDTWHWNDSAEATASTKADLQAELDGILAARQEWRLESRANLLREARNLGARKRVTRARILS